MSVEDGFLADIPTWCLICNSLFEDSVQDHAATDEHKSNYTNQRKTWDTVRVDQDPDRIRNQVERRNAYQHSDEEILEAMADHPEVPL